MKKNIGIIAVICGLILIVIGTLFIILKTGYDSKEESVKENKPSIVNKEITYDKLRCYSTIKKNGYELKTTFSG